VLALVLILSGSAWSLWAVRHLSTCLSVVPQARRLVDTGPYRLVRHPLYLGELVAVGGFAVRGGHWLHVVLLLALLALQLYRASREEALLAGQVPGYAGYAARTWRIVPGVV
jgi:protein-S-isoprenylcysteine O-methyltransferase Ste14